MLKKDEKFIIFSLNQQTCAVPIFDSHQVFAIQNLSPVPMVNVNIAGLTYYDGHIVTVLNTAKILAIKDKVGPKQAVLLRYENHYYAYLVDQIVEIVEKSFLQKNKIKILSLDEILKTLNFHE